MKKIIPILFAVCLLALVPAVCSVDFDSSTVPGLNITTDIDGAFNMSQSENRTLMIVFDQDSCVYCDKFKSDVLSNPEIQKELNKKYVVLLVDINRHPDIAGKYKAFGTPTTQFLDSNGREIYKVEGYVPGDEFMNALKAI